MGNALKYIAGGLLEGLGGGIAQNAQNLREERLKELERQDRRDERRTDMDFRAGEAASAREFTGQQNDLNRDANATERASARGDISSTTTDAEGNLIGITRGGDTRPLGVTTKPPRGLSVEDDRLLKRLENKYISEDSISDPTEEERQAANQNVAADLRRRGRDDLANLYVAQQPAPPGQTGASGQPQGAGTQENPFTPSTQEELEWVRQNRPDAMVSVDGKLMRVSGS